MYGRFNKWAAKALLANIYLNAQVYVNEAKWADCLQQCNDIIASGKYNLEANYKDIFQTRNEYVIEFEKINDEWKITELLTKMEWEYSRK